MLNLCASHVGVRQIGRFAINHWNGLFWTRPNNEHENMLSCAPNSVLNTGSNSEPRSNLRNLNMDIWCETICLVLVFICVFAIDSRGASPFINRVSTHGGETVRLLSVIQLIDAAMPVMRQPTAKVRWVVQNAVGRQLNHIHMYVRVCVFLKHLTIAAPNICHRHSLHHETN